MHSCITLRDDTGPPQDGRPETAGEAAAARAAALCEQAAAAVRAGDPPEALLWLAEQLADTCRILSQYARAGTVAAAAYEAGRLDERARRAPA